MVRGEAVTDKSVARSSFLMDTKTSQRRVVVQSRIKVYTGLEWALREIVKDVAHLAAEVSMSGEEARGWEEWEGGEEIAASSTGTEREEQQLWKMLEELDREMYKEQKKTDLKKAKKVEKSKESDGSRENPAKHFRKYEKSSKCGQES